MKFFFRFKNGDFLITIMRFQIICAFFIFLSSTSGENNARFSDELAPEVASHLQGLAKKLATDNTIILTAASFGFIPSVVNFVAQLRRLYINNFIILATDKQSFDFFNTRNLYNVHFSDDAINQKYNPDNHDELIYYRMTSVWVKRTKVMKYLLFLGYDVIQTDSDAIWLNNPVPLFRKIVANNDVLFSRGKLDGENPGTGIGICMGFVYYRATQNTLRLLGELLKVMKENFWPDQGSINSFIWGPNRENKDGDPYAVELVQHKYSDYLTFALIPQTVVARHIGKVLMTIPAEKIHLAVFHPVVMGWDLPFYCIPRMFPPEMYQKVTQHEYWDAESIARKCNPGGWYPREVYHRHSMEALMCLGVWLIKDRNLFINLPNQDWLEINGEVEKKNVGSRFDFDTWLEENSYLTVVRNYTLFSSEALAFKRYVHSL